MSYDCRFKNFPLCFAGGQETGKMPKCSVTNDDRRKKMSDHAYKMLELVGSSTKGSDEAIQNAIIRASKSMRNLDWFEVVETRGHLLNGKVAHWQVKIKVGFRMED
jgi:hypothetical protein